MTGSLAGKTIVITRAEEDCPRLEEKLTELDARVLVCPSIDFALNSDLRDWNAALENRTRWTHAALTSPRAVSFFADLLEAASIGPDKLTQVKMAAIGDRTASELEARGFQVHYVCHRSTGIDFATGLVDKCGVGPGSIVVLPQSDLAKSDLGDLLRRSGSTLLRSTIYETRTAKPASMRPLLDELDAGHCPDALTFASPSAARATAELLGDRLDELVRAGTRLVAIGPTTSEELTSRGWRVDAEAAQPGLPGLVRAVVDCVAPAD